jgi:hypothetical protein
MNEFLKVLTNWRSLLCLAVALILVGIMQWIWY